MLQNTRIKLFVALGLFAVGMGLFSFAEVAYGKANSKADNNDNMCVDGPPYTANS